MRSIGGTSNVVEGDHVVIATGSHPRSPPEVPIDHENIFDSDSILSMTYLPSSLTVLGAGKAEMPIESEKGSVGPST